MNKYDFTALVKNPNNIGEIETEKLRDLVQAYPYFSVARNLLVKSLFRSSHYEYENALKQAALQTGNRTVLYNLVHDLPLNTDSLVFADQVVEELEISQNKDISAENLVQAETQLEEKTAVGAFIVSEEVSTESEVERLVIPEEVEDLLEDTSSISTEITEEEQLVKPTGKFVKFIPKKPAIETKQPPSNSLIQTKQEEQVLNEFDISSLNTLSNWQPSRPLYEETPTPEIKEDKIEATIGKDTAPDATIEPLVIPETVKFTSPTIENDVIVPSSVISDFDGKTEVADDDFLAWLRKKKSVKIEEDVKFVNNFTQAFSEQSNQSLADEINLHLPEIEDKTKHEPELIQQIPESKTEPAFEFNFDFGKQAVPQSDAKIIVETNLLASLEDYEIDIFLAQVYKSVKFDGQMFDHQFTSYFPEVDKPTHSAIEEIQQKIQPVVAPPKVGVQETPKPKVPAQTEISIPKLVSNEEAELPKIVEFKEIASVEAEKPEFKPKRNPKKEESILDKFIRENPTIARPKSEFYNPVNMAKQSVESDDELVSETLAAIYLLQGFHKKAISMYEKLGLLYPDKLAYFAGLIEKIKNENNLN